MIDWLMGSWKSSAARAAEMERERDELWCCGDFRRPSASPRMSALGRSDLLLSVIRFPVWTEATWT